MKKKLIYIITFILFLQTASFSNAKGLKVRIDQPIADNFPYMKTYVSVTDKSHKPVLSLVRGNFSVWVDGEKVESDLDVAGFQYAEEGISYSLIISSNGIMEGEPLHQQVKAAITLLESIREQDTLSLYSFGSDIKTVFEFQKKDESLVEKISKVEPVGGNPRLYDALVYVTKRTEKASLKRRVVLIMSDGRENESRYTKKQLFDVLDEVNIPIYSIGIKLMEGHNLFRIASISKHSGGAYVYTKTPKKIPNYIKVLNNEIQLGYVLSFKVNNVAADNKLHQLEIKIDQAGKKSSFAKNFIAHKVPLSFWLLVTLIILSIIALVILIIFYIIMRRRMRKKMGITKRKCPTCKQRMKDEWDECMFCKYLPPKKKRLKKLKEKMA